MIRNTLIWIKTNFILVIAVLICLGSIGFVVYIHLEGQGFINRVQTRSNEISKISGLLSTSVTIPPEKPDDPPRRDFIAVNQAAIDALQKIYGDMKNEYENIYHFAVSINQRGHEPMLEGLFPTSTAIRAFDAREYYRSALPEFFKPFSPTAPQPRLDAANAPSSEDLDAAMKRAEVEYRTNNLISADATLSNSQEAELVQFKTKRLIDFYVSEAKKIHIYAQTDPRQRDYPFHLMAWANETNQPDPRDLWEAQMQLWVIQDLVHAIGQTNRVDNREVNVMNAPIKRLLLIDLNPDYVGITGRGAMNEAAPNSAGAGMEIGGHAFRPGAPANMPGGPAFQPPGFGNQANAPGSHGAAPAASGGNSINTKLPDDFSLAATGRRSNDIYDVRHVWVTLIMDSQHMPEFFEALAQTNFMTVLKLEVKDEDEYTAAKDGYIYGPGDSVKVTMLIETIWLREWTAAKMPPAVRDMLGINAPSVSSASNN